MTLSDNEIKLAVMDLVIASNNIFKVNEIKAILQDKFDRIYSLFDKGIDIDIEEKGRTFYANALIKAKAVYDIVGIPVIADDSGLCVKALNNQPGIYSARFAGFPCNDEANNDKLLRELAAHNDRSAEFVSEVVLYLSPDDIRSGKGKVSGIILSEGKGRGGFGYDPLFYSLDLKKTFAEASPSEKNAVSHRARALMDLLSRL